MGGLANLLQTQLGDDIVPKPEVAGAINAIAVQPWYYQNQQRGGRFSHRLDANPWQSFVSAEGARSHIAILSRRGSNLEDLFHSSWPGTGEPDNTREVQDLVEVTFVAKIYNPHFILMAIAATGIANTVIMAAYENTEIELFDP